MATRPRPRPQQWRTLETTTLYRFVILSVVEGSAVAFALAGFHPSRFFAKVENPTTIPNHSLQKITLRQRTIKIVCRAGLS